MELTDAQKAILDKWPEKPHPGVRLPYGYQVKAGDSSKIVPNTEIIFVLEDVLDQMANGLSLRDAAEQLNYRVPKNFSLSHQGLKKVRARLRPNDPVNPSVTP